MPPSPCFFSCHTRPSTVSAAALHLKRSGLLPHHWSWKMFSRLLFVSLFLHLTAITFFTSPPPLIWCKLHLHPCCSDPHQGSLCWSTAVEQLKETRRGVDQRAQCQCVCVDYIFSYKRRSFDVKLQKSCRRSRKVDCREAVKLGADISGVWSLTDLKVEELSVMQETFAQPEADVFTLLQVH